MYCACDLRAKVPPLAIAANEPAAWAWQIARPSASAASLPGLPGKDAADALGLAICHAHAAGSFAAIAKGGTLARKSHAQYKGGRSY